MLRARVRDDLAYLLPMGIFLAFTQAGSTFPGFYPLSYLIKTVLAGIALVILWPHYTRIRWRYWPLGIALGVVGVVQWVGMETLLLRYFPNYPRLHVDPFRPYDQIADPRFRTLFLAVRLAGPVLVVPFMEELFWRDFAWRSILAPNDFKLAGVGEFDWSALLIVSAIFASVHIQWLTAFVWGLMIGGLLIYTRSLGACILMHAVTNLLLGVYVLKTGDWKFW